MRVLLAWLAQFAPLLQPTRSSALLLLASVSCLQTSDSGRTVVEGTYSLAAGTQRVPADGTSVLPLTATLRTKGGGALAGVQVMLACADANAVLVQPNAAGSDAQGQVVGGISSAVPGTYHVTAEAVFAGQRVAFANAVDVTLLAIDAVVTPTLSVTALPARVVANGRDAATITVQVRAGAAASALAPWVGKTATLRGSNANDLLEASTGTLDGNGQFVTTVRSTVAGERTLVAQVDELTAQAAYRFAAGPSFAANSRLIVENRISAGDGLDGLDVRLQLQGAFANPVTDAPVQLRSTDGNVTFDAADGTTDSTGAYATVFRTTSLGQVPFSAEAGALALAGSGNFVVGPVSVARSRLVLPAEPIVADGVSLASVTVLLRDAAGHAVPNAPVDFLLPANSGNLTFVGDSNVTDASGALTVQFTSTATGPLQVVASTVAGTLGGGAQAGNVGAGSPNAVVVQAQVPFGPGSPAASTSSFVLASGSLVADGNATGTIVLTVRDALGHLVPQVPITFSSPVPGMRFVPATGSTDANGRLILSVGGTQAGAALVVAALPATSLTATVPLVAGPAKSSSSSLVVSPSAVPADDVTSAAVDLQLRDAFGNAVANQAVNFSLVGSGNVTVPAAAARLSTTTATTNAQGGAQLGVAGWLAGDYSVVASYAGTSQRANVRLLAGGANVVVSSLTAQPQTGAVADGTAPVLLRAQIRDSFGNPLAGQSGLWSSTATGDAFSVASGLSDGNGLLTTTLRGTVAANRTVTAAIGGSSGSGGIALSCGVGLVAGPPAANKSVLLVAPTSTVADGVAQATLTLTARDAFGNAAGAVPVQLAATGNDAFTPAQGVTDAAGNFAATWTTTVAGTRGVTAALGSPAVANLTTQQTFVAGSVAAATSSVVLQANALVAGAAPVAFDVRLRDAYGNPVAATALTLTDTGGDLLLPVTSGITGSGGTWRGTVAATVAGPKVIQVTTGGTTLLFAFNVMAAATDLAASQLTVAPAVVAAGTASTATLRLRDAYNNAVAGANVTFAAEPNAGSVLSPTVAVTAADGTVSSQLIRKQIGSGTVRATTATGTWSGAFTIQAATPNATLTSFAAAPNQAIADTVGSVGLRLVVRDAYGNAVGARPVSFASSDANDVLVPTTATTAADGSVTARLASAVAGNKTVTAVCDGASKDVAVRLLPGPLAAATSSLAIAPTDGTVADGAASANVTLWAADAYGNPLAGANVHLLVAPAGASLTAAVGASAADGGWQATLDGNGRWQGALRAASAGNVTVTANLADKTLAATARFVPAAADAAKSRLSISPDTVAADGVATASVSLFVYTAAGQPLAQVPVTLTASAADAAFTIGSGTTQADGTFASAISATVAEDKIVTAQVGNLTLTAPVHFVTATATDPVYALVAEPNQVVAGSGAAAQLTFVAATRGGQPLPGVAVNLAATAGNVTLAAGSGSTDANGRFVTTGQIGATGAAEVTATAGGQSTAAQLVGLAGEANASRSLLQLQPSVVVADGNSVVSLLATLRDAYGNPVAAVPVSFAFAATGGGNATLPFVPADGVTNQAGQLAGAVQTTVAQRGNVTLSTAAGLLLQAPVQFVAGVPRPQTSTFVAEPAQIVADNVATATLRLRVRDARNNPVAAAAVEITADGPDVQLAAGAAGAPHVGVTDAAGELAVTVRGTVAGSRAIVAQVADLRLVTAVVLQAGPADANASRLLLAPSSAVADGTASLAATMQLRDAYANPIIGQDVLFELAGAGAYVPAARVATDGNGEAVSWLGSELAEPKLVTATDANSGVAAVATATFVAGPVSGGQSSWSGDGNLAVADDNQLLHFTFVARDAFANPVPQATVFVTSDGIGDTVTPVSGVTDAQGRFVVAWRSQVAASKALTVTYAGGSSQQQATFIAGPPVAARTTLSAPATPVPADNASPLRVTVTLADAFGNLVAGQNLVVSSANAGDVVSQAAGSTDAYGQWTAEVRGSTAGSRIVTASFAATSRAQAFSLVAGPASSATSSLELTPGAAVADGVQAVQVRVLARDGFGNLVPGSAVALTATGQGHAFARPSGVTEVDGSYSTTLVSTVAQSKTIEAALTGVTLGDSVRFVAGPPAASQSTLAVLPAQVTADGNAVAALVATFKDSFANPCANVTVAFASQNVADGFVPAQVATDASGTATTALRSTVAGNRSVTAIAGAAQKAALVAFVADTPTAEQSTFAVQPNAVTADGSSTALLTVVATDAHGNPAAFLPLRLVAVAADANDVLRDAQGVRAGGDTSVTGATDGNGRFSATLASRRAGRHQLVATLGNTALAAEANFVAGAASSVTSLVSVSPSPLVADGNAAATVQVVVQDAFGNPVVGQTVALNVSGGNNVIEQVSGVSDATGRWQTSLRSSKAQAKTVTAQLGSTAVATQVNFVAPGTAVPRAQLDLSPLGGIAADGVAEASLRLRVVDGQGQPLAGLPVTWSVRGQGQQLTVQNANTTAAGEAEATLRGTVAETKTVLAQVGNVVVQKDVRFVAGAVAPGQSLLMVSPNVVVADGSSGAQLAVRLADAYGNLVAGAPVTFSASGDGTTVAAAGVATNKLGVATATLRSRVAEDKTVTASFAGGSLTAPIRFVANAADNAGSSFVASPNPTTADGLSVATLTVQLVDRQRNPVQGQNVTFGSNVVGDVLSSNRVATDEQGQAQVTLSSTQVGPRTLIAQAQGTALTTQLNFASGAASASSSWLAASPNRAVADGVAGVRLQVLVADDFGNPLVGAPVTWTADNPPNSFTAATSVTNDAGIASTVLRSPLAANKTVSASLGATSLTIPVRFVAGPADASQSSWLASSSEATADGNAALTLVLTARDAQANVVAAQDVAVVVGGQNVVVTPNVGATDATGSFTTSLRSVHAQATQATVWVGSVALTTPVRFVADAPTNQSVSLAVSPAVQIADGTSTVGLTFRAADPLGNPIVAAPVTFSAASSNVVLTPASQATAADGRSQSQATSTQLGSLNLYASLGNVVATSSATFVAGEPDAAQSILNFSPTDPVADGNSATTVTVAIRDALGHPVAQELVALVVAGDGAELTPSAVRTDASGGASAQLRATVAGAKTITATFAGSSIDGNVTFVAGPVSNANSSFVAQAGGNAQLVANDVDVVVLTFVGRDNQNNPTAGHTVSFASVGAQATVDDPVVVADANGVAQTTARTKVAGSRSFVATVDGTSLTTSQLFVAGEPNAAASALTLSPNQAIADAASPVTVGVVLRDAFANPVRQATVTLTATGQANAFTPTSLTTDATGTASAVLTSTVAEPKVVTATAGPATFGGNVTFVAGPAIKATSSLQPTPASVAAGQTVTLQLVARDQFNNLVAGQSFALAASNAPAPAPTVTPSTVATATDGTAQATFVPTRTPQASVTADAGGFSLQANVAVTPAPVNLSNSKLLPVSTTRFANNQNAAVLTLTLRDNFNNLVPSVATSWTATGSNVTVAPASGSTDGNGTLLAQVTSSDVQLTAVQAQAAGLTWQANVTFIPGPVDANQSSLIATPASLTAATNANVSLAVRLRDAQARPMAAQRFGFQLSATADKMDPAQGTTDAAGNAAARYTPVGAGAHTVAVSAGGARIFAQVPVVPPATAACAGAAMLGGPPAVATPGSQVQGIVTADINDDGYVDVVVVDANTSRLATYLGNGSGMFQGPQLQAVTLQAPIGLAQGDLNGDGVPDLLVANTGGNNVVALLGQGDGNFVNPRQVAAVTSPSKIRVADIDGDGRRDLVVTSNANAVVWALGSGDGNFLPARSQALAGAAVGIASGDFDGDGYVDLAATTKGVGLSILYGTGGGNMAAPVTLTGLNNPTSVASGRFNADTYADFAVTDDVGGHRLIVFVSTAARTYQALPSLTAGLRYPGAVAATDWSGDGNLDLVVVAGQTNSYAQLTAFRGLGDGNFVGDANTPFLSYGGIAGLGSAPSIGAADVNGDGRSDIVVANKGQLVTFLAATPNTFLAATNVPSLLNATAADLTGDGAPDLLSSSSSGSSVTLQVSRNDGNGTFTLGQTLNDVLPPNGRQGSVLLADWSGDGLADAVVLDTNNGAATLLRNAGDANLVLTTRLATCPGPSQAAVADLNGDGLPDLVVGCSGQYGVAVHLGLGGGVLAPPTIAMAGVSRFGIVLGDVNGDGIVDIVSNNVATSVPDGTAAVALGDGTGAFAAPVMVPGARSIAVVLADVDEDGRPDIVTVPQYGKDVLLARNLGAGTFASATVVASASTALNVQFGNVAVGDLRGSGHLDLIAVTGQSPADVGGDMWVWSGRGDGTFGPERLYTTHYLGAAGVSVVDVDRDGRQDVVLASNRGTGSVVLRNAGCAVKVVESPNTTRSLTATNYAAGNAGGVAAVADNVASVALTVTVRDAHKNLVANTPVAAVADGNNGTFSPSSGYTDAQGQFTTSMRTTVAGIRTVTFVAGNLPAVASIPTPVTFVAGEPNIASCAIVAVPHPQAIDETGGMGLRVFAGDVYGNPVAGVDADLTASGANITFTPGRVTSDGNGLSGALPLRSTQVGDKHVTAALSNNGTSLGQVQRDVTFVGGKASSGNTTLTVANPNAGVVAGNTNVLLTLRAYDVAGNASAFRRVKLTSTQPADVFTARPRATNVNGVLDDQLYGTFAGPRKITATLDGVSRTAAVQFAAKAPYCATRTRFTSQPAVVTAGASADNSSKTPGSALADIDGDGKDDLIVLSQGQNSLLTYRSYGDGTFAPPTSYALGCQPNQLVTANFAGDAKPDFAVGCLNANRVVLLTNAGNGNYTVATLPTFPARSSGVAVGDVTGDGQPDVVAYDPNSGVVATYVNQGGNFVLAASRQVTGGITDAKVGHLTGSAYGDVIVASGNTNTLLYLAAAADGTLGAPTPLLTVGTPVSLDVAMMDANTHLGVAIKAAGGGNDYVATFDHAGGLLALKPVFAGGVGVVRFVDWDADGYSDVLSLSRNDKTGNQVTSLARDGGTGQWSEILLPRYSTIFPSTFSLGDINGDGRTDLLTTTYNGVSHAQLSDANYSLPMSQVALVGRVSDPLQLADFDNDGNLDLVTIGESQVRVAYGDGAGGFSRVYVSLANDANDPTSALKRQFTVVDVDGDGWPDVVAQNANAPTGLVVWRNDGTGKFQRPSFQAENLDIREPVAVDFDGDGIVDLAAGENTSGNGNFRIYRGLGDGNFVHQATYSAGRTYPVTLTAGAFGANGAPGLVVAPAGGVVGIPVYANNGAGVLSIAASLNVGNVTNAFAQDFNGDGNVDVGLVSGADGLYAFLGRGNTSFDAAIISPFVSRYDGRFLYTGGKVADFNGDGWPDLVVLSDYASTATVLYGLGNGSFRLGGVYMTATGLSRGVAAADFNNDGRVDLAITGRFGCSADPTTSGISILFNEGCLAN